MRSGFGLENRLPKPHSTFDLLVPRRGLRTLLPAFVWVSTHPPEGPTWKVTGRSPFGCTNLCSLSSSHPYPTKQLAATCCMPYRCKKHFLHDSVWGWNESKWFGKAARGAWKPGGPCPQRERHAGLSSSPHTGQAPCASCRPKPCPRPSSHIVSCHTAFGSGDGCGVLRNIFKSPFPCSGGSRWKAEPLKGRYFERPHRQFSNKRASKAGIYPKLSNWPSLLIWDLMPPNQTNSKSHLLNFSAQFFF